MLRIWTQDPARFASRETLMAFDVDMVRAEYVSISIVISISIVKLVVVFITPPR